MRSDTRDYLLVVNSRSPKSYEQVGCVTLFADRSNGEASGLDRFESTKAAAVEVIEQREQVAGSAGQPRSCWRYSPSWEI